jgi:hypothetical protein
MHHRANINAIAIKVLPSKEVRQRSDSARRQTGEKQPVYYCIHTRHTILMLAHVLRIRTKQAIDRIILQHCTVSKSV